MENKNNRKKIISHIKKEKRWFYIFLNNELYTIAGNIFYSKFISKNPRGNLNVFKFNKIGTKDDKIDG